MSLLGRMLTCFAWFCKITVSTVGLVPELRRLAAETSVQVALSLHATTDEVRSWIAPINRKCALSARPWILHFGLV
jgi:adenine C2-methylase RlmN of 23S rRNA A2503 and tRNA A37